MSIREMLADARPLQRRISVVDFDYTFPTGALPCIFSTYIKTITQSWVALKIT